MGVCVREKESDRERKKEREREDRRGIGWEKTERDCERDHGRAKKDW